MTPSLKICGLNTPDAVDAALAAGADYLGFVIYPRSPRHVDPHAAGALARRKGRARSVAVLVDPDDGLLAQVLVHMRPDVIQLHGEESPLRCHDARQYAEHAVWKALGIAAPEDLAAADRYRGHADGFVFDARPPADASRPGGLGLAWDYGILRGCDPGAPWLLAGGLTADSVAAAVAASGAPGVDVVSGVESAPGVKDPARIAAFAAALRAQGGLP